MHSHPSSSTDTTRPFLKWTGGKQRLLKQLLPLLPQGRRLIEPFMGAGSVFLGTSYPSYLLNDANADLASVWRALKQRPEEFCTLASQHFVEENRSKEAFLSLRDRFNQTSDAFVRATLLPYLNRFGFNGLYRVNSKGRFNSPYGHPQKLPPDGRDLMMAAARKLERAEVMCGDFLAALEAAAEGDVVYCDPPYSDLEHAPSFVGYTSRRFGPEQHVRLVEASLAAVRRGATVLISNHNTPETRDLYRGWDLHQLEVRRSVSADPERRGTALELVAIKRP